MRDYHHIPRPTIEDHYHIRELIENQEKKSDNRTYHRNKEKEKEEREALIKDAKLVVMTDFWCTQCQKDFKSVAIRQIEQDWSNETQRIAFYKSKHDCGKWVMRLITDKFRDGFWTQSKNIARDRGVFFADTIQPHETGFNMLYGRKNK